MRPLSQCDGLSTANRWQVATSPDDWKLFFPCFVQLLGCFAASKKSTVHSLRCCDQWPLHPWGVSSGPAVACWPSTLLPSIVFLEWSLDNHKSTDSCLLLCAVLRHSCRTPVSEPPGQTKQWDGWPVSSGALNDGAAEVESIPMVDVLFQKGLG